MRLFQYVSLVLASCIYAQSQSDSTTIADSLLTLQLQSQMQPQAAITQNAPIVRSAPSTNPDISAIGDFRTSYSSGGPRNIETYFNALEVQVSSVVDPYAAANFLFSFGKDSVNGDFSAGLEVATLTSLSLPYSFQVTLGKFKPHFTKVNTFHPHAFSFVEFPTMIKNYFGDEGLFMEGMSASVLLPNPWDFYQELDVEIGRSATTPSLDNGSSNRLLYSVHLNNFFELSENSTLGIGLSGLSGVNAFDLPTTMGGFDLTYKWKPVQFNTYHSFTWQTEALICNTDTTAGTTIQSYGAYTFLEYQIEKRTFVGARFDYSGLPGLEKSDERTTALLLRFQPTEFQILALEFQNVNRNYGSSFYQVVFRAIFGIGTHAAHAY
ncbi:MAG: hypothetical protein Q8L88_12220 [Bacteroidota bacterium]|nr:hypothetical protein [Bacteroidota bacterium]